MKPKKDQKDPTRPAPAPAGPVLDAAQGTKQAYLAALQQPVEASRKLPKRLTPQIHALILATLRDGNRVDTAARFAGLDSGTVRGWIARGRADLSKNRRKTIYALFTLDVDRAEAIAEVKDVNHLTSAAQAGEWRAAAWRLERRHGWIKREEITGPDAGPIQVQAWSADKRAELLNTLVDALEPKPDEEKKISSEGVDTGDPTGV